MRDGNQYFGKRWYILEEVCEKGDGRMTRFVGESLAMCERNDDFFAWNINHQLVPIPDYCWTRNAHALLNENDTFPFSF